MIQMVPARALLPRSVGGGSVHAPHKAEKRNNACRLDGIVSGVVGRLKVGREKFLLELEESRSDMRISPSTLLRVLSRSFVHSLI